jgi:four helix bundle protein
MAHFVRMAMGSGAELSYHTLPVDDLGFMTIVECRRLSSELGEIVRMLSSLSRKLRNPMTDCGLAAKS